MSDPDSSGASIESAPIESGYAESSYADSSCGESGLGRYRVRAVDGAEYSAPDQVAGPRFERRDEAERYADGCASARDVRSQNGAKDGRSHNGCLAYDRLRLSLIILDFP